jgi:type VI secretion system protein ImpH
LPWTLEQRLYEEGYAFDFFQAVRLLERLEPQRRPIGHAGPPGAETTRIRAHLSLSFPPSALHEIIRPQIRDGPAVMTATFLGLTGPSGILPRHYTELLLRLDREAKGAVRYALRDWLDLFNHRLLSLFYRAWEKYRFYVPYERGDYGQAEPDAFTQTVFSLVGLGDPGLRGRLRIAAPQEDGLRQIERVLARVDDLVLLYYGGLFAHRPRNAVSLEAMVADYFQLPARLEQFQGQWLHLQESDQTRLGGGGMLGVNTVAGARVWDVQSKARVRLGPLGYHDYEKFLPDRRAVAERKALFVLSHLVRTYVGPELDFDVQLILRAEEVPACRLSADGGLGPRLGWNTWLHSGRMHRDAGDAVFEGEEMVFVDEMIPQAHPLQRVGLA